MNLEGKLVLILLGGTWHDFDGFAAAMKQILEKEGCSVRSTYDLDDLTRLATINPDVIISYTCMTEHRDGYNDTGPEGMTDAQVKGLVDWVRAGGGLLSAHAATVLGSSDAALGDLMGGVFVEHPPQFSFTVYPLSTSHPITSGIEAFTVHDEFYIQKLVGWVDLQMVAIDRGVAFPMVWSRPEGRGRVAHIAMGHSEQVWGQPMYQRLMLQATGWLLGE